MKSTTLSAVVGLSLVIAAPVWAGGGYGGPSSSSDPSSTETTITKETTVTKETSVGDVASNNDLSKTIDDIASNNDLSKTVGDVASNNDLSKTVGDIDSNNDNSKTVGDIDSNNDNSKSVTVGDVASHNAQDSYNTKTVRDSGNLTFKAALSVSNLKAITTKNDFEADKLFGDVYSGNNRASGRLFANAAGISQFAQNTGLASNVQQSVSVQASVTR